MQLLGHLVLVYQKQIVAAISYNIASLSVSYLSESSMPRDSVDCYPILMVLISSVSLLPSESLLFLHIAIWPVTFKITSIDQIGRIEASTPRSRQSSLITRFLSIATWEDCNVSIDYSVSFIASWGQDSTPTRGGVPPIDVHG
jgi:hypothetical protein